MNASMRNSGCHWENWGFRVTDLCWRQDLSAFQRPKWHFQAAVSPTHVDGPNILKQMVAPMKTQPEKAQTNGDLNSKPSKPKPNNESEDEILTEEDQKLLDEINLVFERLEEPDVQLYLPALNHLTDLIRTSTSSMTAIPKPFKFLGPRFGKLEEIYQSWVLKNVERNIVMLLSDILSVLGMCVTDEKAKNITLKYRLQGTNQDPGLWGHEYVRHLAMEIGEEFHLRKEKQEIIDDELEDIRYPELDSLAHTIVPFFLSHNAEADAVDLLMEIELLKDLPQFIDINTHSRVCLYLLGFVKLLPYPENIETLTVIYQIFLNQKKYFDAFACAVQLNDQQLLQSTFDSAAEQGNLTLKQISLFAAAHNVHLNTNSHDLDTSIQNVHLTIFYKKLLDELQLTEPSDPKDIYKVHLDSSRGGLIPILDSSRQCLASCIFSGFLNIATGNDKILLTEDPAKSLIYKTKVSGMISATASIGLLHLWDVESALAHLDQYLFSSDCYIKAGALLAVAIANIGVRNETDPTLAMLSEYLTPQNSENVTQRVSIFGIGLTYAGLQHNESASHFLSFLNDMSTNIIAAALSTLSLGLINLGSADSECASAILQNLMLRSEEELQSKWSIFFVIGLGLLFLTCEDKVEPTLKTLEAISKPIAQCALVFVDACAYAGCGNVLKIQQMLHYCSGSLDNLTNDDDDQGNEMVTDDDPNTEKNKPAESTGKSEKSDKLYNAFATLGIAMIAMGEPIGSEMVMRHLGHLMHYGGTNIRKAVPLAMGLLHISNPDARTFETLSRHSHDGDLDIAINAILAMGLLGAGTNNARLAQLLRQLANYYSRKSSALFIVRLAQGLLHSGKGTISLNPYDTDGRILNKNAFAGLIILLTVMLDPNSFVLSDEHWLLFSLALSCKPRMLFTVDENLNPLPVSVRIGQALDVVGQAGRPKTITGWVTQTTPVLLPYGDRAELATEEYIPLASHLQGVVILQKDPSYMVL